jgi:energy-converting hydrogenase Eha subunit A
MKLKHCIICLFIIALPACTMVEPTRESKEVTLVKPSNVVACKLLATTNATVTYKVGIITRDEKAITEELVTLGKNRAAELGGDSIVAKGPAVEGKMSFDIYKCGN